MVDMGYELFPDVHSTYTYASYDTRSETSSMEAGE